MLPSLDILNNIFHLSEDTGLLYFKPRSPDSFNSYRAFRVWESRFCGKVSGKICKRSGYVKVNVVDTQRMAHRVIFKMVHGFEPEEIDHINGIRHDNRPLNLRSVSRKENNQNSSTFSNNTSGFRGVSWSKQKGCWRSYIKVGGKMIHLGFFKRFGSATDARLQAEKDFGFHRNHGKKAYKYFSCAR